MEAIEAGASDFIVKPFRAEDVLAVVKKVLGEALSAPRAGRSAAPARSGHDDGHVPVPRALRHRGHRAPGGARRDLVQLEREGGAGAVDSMFRHAHSVKGMASSMGFEPIAMLAHRVEDLVDAVRAGPEPPRPGRWWTCCSPPPTRCSAQVRAVAESQPPDEAERAAGPARRARVGAHRPGPGAHPGGATAARAPAPRRGRPATCPAWRPPRPPRSGRPAERARRAALAAPPAAVRRGGAGPAAALRGEGAHRAHLPGAGRARLPGAQAALGPGQRLRPAARRWRTSRRAHPGRATSQLRAGDRRGRGGHPAALRNVAEVELVSVQAGRSAAPPAAAARRARAAPEAPAAGGRGAAPRTVRVRTELLDYFLDTVGELLLATARMREVGKVLPENARPPLEEGVYRLHALVKDLHDKVMSGAHDAAVAHHRPAAPRRPRHRPPRGARGGPGHHRRGDRAGPRHPRRAGGPAAAPAAQLHRPRHRVARGARRRGQEARAGGCWCRCAARATGWSSRSRTTAGAWTPAKLKAAAVARGLITAEAAARMTDREAFMLVVPAGRLHREGRLRHLRPRRGHGRGEARRWRTWAARWRSTASGAAARASRCGCRSPWRWCTCCWCRWARRSSACPSPRWWARWRRTGDAAQPQPGDGAAAPRQRRCCPVHRAGRAAGRARAGAAGRAALRGDGGRTRGRWRWRWTGCWGRRKWCSSRSPGPWTCSRACLG